MGHGWERLVLTAGPGRTEKPSGYSVRVLAWHKTLNPGLLAQVCLNVNIQTFRFTYAPHITNTSRKLAPNKHTFVISNKVEKAL